jgi:D-alanine-D-alanine ligase-like ATP-grasp enzyme
MGKVVVKPAKAGSSIGVKVAFGVNDSIKKATELILEVLFVLRLGQYN